MSTRRAAAAREERGYAMVALLVLMSVMAIAMTAALPAWNTMARREREAELVFRGEQYARAIMLFQRQYAGAFPPNVDTLVNGRFLRKKYKDPITNDDFKTISVGEAISTAQSANPLSTVQGGRAAGSTAGAGGRAGSGSMAEPPAQLPSTAGRSTFSLGGTAGQPGRAGGIGQVGAGAGIMGVTSKSTDASLRIYKGADHYNQWLFIATQAATQAGGRGAQTPGQGVRGGAPPGFRPGGAGPRGAQPPATPFGQQPTPFGPGPFGRGQTTPAPPGGRR